MNCAPPNPFLNRLFSKDSSLLKSCDKQSTIILAPVSSSLNAIDAETGCVYSDNLTEDFMQSHVLRVQLQKGEVLERSRARIYTTLNGKTMVVKGDVVFPHRGFKGVREVRLLHDSLFWPDDPASTAWLVYFLDRPLVGTPTKVVATHRTIRINTWAELLIRYKQVTTIEPTLTKLFNDFNEAVQGDTTIESIRGRLDVVVTGAIRAFQSLPQALLHTIGTECSISGPEIEKLIESHILDALYDHLFYKLTLITLAQDEELALAIERCKYVDLTQLGTISTLDLRRRHQLAIESFRGFGEFHAPLRKLEALLSTITMLMRNSEKSSDDLIPSLVSVVLKAGVSSLCANMLWIREFAFKDVDGGENGFAMSTLEAVIYHITSSVESLSVISSENQAFLRDIQAMHVPFRDIRDLANRPALLLANDIEPYLQYCTASSLEGLLGIHPTRQVLEYVLNSDDCQSLINEQDSNGQTIAHKLHEHDFLDDIHQFVNWTLKDKQGNTPLQVLARIYDHPEYEELLERVFRKISPIMLADHIDAKGNTLAHVASSRAAMVTVLTYCEGDFDTLNDKGLSALLMSIKFARIGILELLLTRPEINPLTRDLRGHSAIHYAARSPIDVFQVCEHLDINDRATGSGVTALHIAARDGNIPVLKRLLKLGAEEAFDWRGYRPGDIVKNDLVRNIMDDWACRGREVRVLRGHVGEDCSVKFLIKSKSGGGVLRSVQEFSKLRQWMMMRFPCLGVASLHLDVPPPCLMHSRPSRAILLALTERLDAFIQSLLSHSEIKEYPLLWEFLLSPVTDDMESTITREVNQQQAIIWRGEGIASFESSQMFLLHARDQVVQLSSVYRVFERKTRAMKDANLNLSVAYGLVAKSLSDKSIEDMSDALVPREPSVLYRLIEDVTTIDCRISGLLSSLAIPLDLLGRIEACTYDITQCERQLAPRFLDSQSRKNRLSMEIEGLQLTKQRASSSVRYNEAILADELSSFYESHELRIRCILRDYTRNQLLAERAKLKMMNSIAIAP